MALNLDELMIGDIILNDEGKPCVVEGLYRNQIYTNKGVYLSFEINPMPLSEEFLLANGFYISYQSISGNTHYRLDLDTGLIFIKYDSDLGLLNYPKLGYPWTFKVYNAGIGEFNAAQDYLYNIYDLQHAIKSAKLNITLNLH